MWPQLINTALGIWLMAAPAVLHYGRPASTNEHIVGPLIATFACIAMWEATRPVRWVNLPLGIWTMVAPWFLHHPPGGQLNNFVCGIAIAAFSCLRGKRKHRFAGGWSALWSDPNTVEEA